MDSNIISAPSGVVTSDTLSMKLLLQGSPHVSRAVARRETAPDGSRVRRRGGSLKHGLGCELDAAVVARRVEPTCKCPSTVKICASRPGTANLSRRRHVTLQAHHKSRRGAVWSAAKTGKKIFMRVRIVQRNQQAARIRPQRRFGFKTCIVFHGRAAVSATKLLCTRSRRQPGCKRRQLARYNCRRCSRGMATGVGSARWGAAQVRPDAAGKHPPVRCLSPAHLSTQELAVSSAACPTWSRYRAVAALEAGAQRVHCFAPQTIKSPCRCRGRPSQQRFG
jgi:hypothetical protein